MSKRVCIIAPHFSLPAMDGADISIRELALFLKSNNCHVSFLCKDGFVDDSFLVNNGSLFEKRQKIFAAVISILFFRPYIVCRYKLPFRSIIRNEYFDIVIYSYLGFYNEFRKSINSSKHFIWTHNFDLKWFKVTLPQPPHVLLFNTVNSIVTRYIIRQIKYHGDTLINVTDTDSLGYGEYGLKCITVGVGISGVPIISNKKFGKIPILGFVGSLGNDMNYNALLYFSKCFWPILKRHVSEFRLIGSSPSDAVLKLARRHNWVTLFDLEDATFNDEVSNLDYLVMPFTENNGFKLKTLLSLKFGLPILATSAIILPHRIMGISSDDANTWVDYLINSNLEERDQTKFFELFESYTWSRTLQPLLNHIF